MEKLIDGYALARKVLEKGKELRDGNLMILAGMIMGFVNQMPEAEAFTEKKKRLENLEKVNAELEKRIAELENGRWRDVKTDPPKEYCDCIVVANGESELARCGFDMFGVLHFDTPDVYESEEIKGVTHWMPIPEPPKGAESDG